MTALIWLMASMITAGCLAVIGWALADAAAERSIRFQGDFANTDITEAFHEALIERYDRMYPDHSVKIPARAVVTTG